jgi:uncharacterized membrane protein YdjX (TVP38/TMEM64 family)
MTVKAIGFAMSLYRGLMPADSTGRDTIRAAVSLAAAVLLLSGLALVIWRGLAAQGISIATLQAGDVEGFVRGWGAWSAAASVMLMVLHSFLPLPAEIIPIANGILFGPLPGIALTWLGAMLGAVLSFALARALGRPFVRLAVSDARWAEIERVSPRPGTLLLVRLVPLISFNLVNYAAGLMGVSWWRFLWTTALGILPLTIAMVLAGSEILKTPLWMWIVAALALAVLWLLFRRRAQQMLR